MKIKIDYGRSGLEFRPDPKWDLDVISAKAQKPFIDPLHAIQKAINNPIGSPKLKEIIEEKKEVKQVCIVASDATRPIPSQLILEPLISSLNKTGIKDDKIIVLIATGLHRGSREDEHKIILGKNLINRIKVLDHDSRDINSLKKIETPSQSLFVNKKYYESDLKILTGYVEPHFFFGFSGGRKSILPGISGQKNIQSNHSAEMINSKFSRFGFYHENLMHVQSTNAAKAVGVDFAVNVCVDKNHNITNVAAGNFEEVHEELVAYQKSVVFHPVTELYDIVICGNGGYPLDLNLYQAVKSMAIGELAVKKGGSIISVNECIEGIGIAQDKFKELIFSGINPKELHRKIIKKEIVVPDQWEIQVLVRILQKADIYVISNLKKNEIGNIGLKYSLNLRSAIKNALRKHGEKARILVLPNGPQALPTLKKK